MLNKPKTFAEHTTCAQRAFECLQSCTALNVALALPAKLALDTIVTENTASGMVMLVDFYT